MLGAVVAAVERLEDPLPLGLGDAGALVDDADDDTVADDPGADQDRPALAVADRVLEQVREGALELGGVGASGSAGRRSTEIRTPRDRRRPSPRGRLQHLGRGRPARGAARPCRSPGRETSSRFSTRRERRWPSPTTASLSSARSASVRVGESSAAPAAIIEVSGVRRSWETERSSAVFSSSLRRSASASITSACMRSRSRESSASSASARSAALAVALGLLGAGARQPRRASWRRRRRPRRRRCATSSRSSAIEKRPSGGDVEPVEGGDAGHRGQQPQARIPRRSRRAGRPADRRCPARQPEPRPRAGRRSGCQCQQPRKPRGHRPRSGSGGWECLRSRPSSKHQSLHCHSFRP